MHQIYVIIEGKFPIFSSSRQPPPKKRKTREKLVKENGLLHSPIWLGGVVDHIGEGFIMRIEGLCWHVWVAGRVAAAIWCRGCRRTLGCARSDSPDGGDNRNCSSSDTTTTHPLAVDGEREREREKLLARLDTWSPYYLTRSSLLGGWRDGGDWMNGC